MISNKSGLLLVTVIEAGGGGGGALASINNRLKNDNEKIEETSKEKYSLTKKLVGYRNWRQRWCKKEENKVLRKE